jgi:hypothetical protein
MSSLSGFDKRPGWLTFAAVVMFAVGAFRVISGISYLASSHKVNDLTGGLFGGQLWVWGLWDLIIAGVAIFAALSLMQGGGFGKFIAYLWGVLVIIESFLQFGLAPWYAAAAITLAVVVIYGVASTQDYSTA